MALILDPIESGINSLLAPFTSVASTTDPINNNPSISATATPLASSIIIITPVGSSKTSTSTAKTTSSGKSSSSIRTTSGKDASSTILSTTPTTLVTSTISSSTTSSTDSSTSSTTTDTTSSSSKSTPSPPVPTPFPSAPSAASSSSNSNAPSPPSAAPISTAGIVIAIIFTVAIIASIMWLVARFCPPVRNRIDAWTARRRRERSYREALDGPAVPAKDSGSEPYSASSSDHSYARDKHFSFFALGHNPQINTNAAVVHQQYVSPHSATPHGHGLGLGRVSLLRNHSLLRKAGHDVPDVPPVMREIAAPHSTQNAGTVSMPLSGEGSQAGNGPVMTRGRNSPLPRLQVDIPHVGMDAEYGRGTSTVPRVSQIGLAVTGTPNLSAPGRSGVTRHM